MLKPPSSGPRDASIAVAPRSLRATLNGAFRYWRAALAVFLAVLLLGVLAAVAVPPAYRAQARLLVLSAGVYDMQGDNGAPQTAQGMNPTDLANVEIQLLESAELHRAVARTELGAGANAQAIAQRAAAIESALHVTKATEANVVELNYSDRDSVAAARTLDRLLLSGFYVVPLYYLPDTWIAHGRDIVLPARKPAFFLSTEVLARLPATPAPAN